MSITTYLAEIELFERWNKKISLGTIRNWRAAKINRGPAFVKFGSRVLYPEHSVEEFEKQAFVDSAVTAAEETSV